MKMTKSYASSFASVEVWQLKVMRAPVDCLSNTYLYAPPNTEQLGRGCTRLRNSASIFSFHRAIQLPGSNYTCATFHSGASDERNRWTESGKNDIYQVRIGG